MNTVTVYVGYQRNFVLNT